MEGQSWGTGRPRRKEDGDVRGGLDDALDKLARRDELRRRAAGETGGTPPAVTELVEAIAAVVSRNPQMRVTVGVEGAADPVLLHFAMTDGVVQVTADTPVTARPAETTPRHADFEIDVEDPVEVPPPAPPRATRDDQDRFGPTTDFDYVEVTTAEQPVVTNRYEPTFGYGQAVHPVQGNVTPQPFAAPAAPPPSPPVPPHPYAAVPHQGYPPPHPPASSPRGYAEPYPAAAPPAHQHQTPHHQAPQHQTPHHQSSQHQTSQHQGHLAPHPAAAQHPAYTAPHPYPPAYPAQHTEPQPQPAFPEPLPEPIPLQVERPEETEMAARRLAALLRSDPSLLDGPQ